MDNQQPVLYTAKESTERDGLFSPIDYLESMWAKITEWNIRNGFAHLNSLNALMILVPDKADDLAKAMGTLAHVEISFNNIKTFLNAYKAARDVIVGWHHKLKLLDNRQRNIGKLHTPNTKPTPIKKELEQCGLFKETQKNDVLRKPRIQQSRRRSSRANSDSK